MIIDDIKNSIRNAVYQADNEIIFHFEEIKHTGYPFCCLILKDFIIEPSTTYGFKRNELTVELLYVKSKENQISQLLEAQKMLSDTLLPVIDINDKKITPENVVFFIKDKTLFMDFKLCFYTYEEDETETMETLDITLKEN